MIILIPILKQGLNKEEAGARKLTMGDRRGGEKGQIERWGVSERIWTPRNGSDMKGRQIFVRKSQLPGSASPTLWGDWIWRAL